MKYMKKLFDYYILHSFIDREENKCVLRKYCYIFVHFIFVFNLRVQFYLFYTLRTPEGPITEDMSMY